MWVMCHAESHSSLELQVPSETAAQIHARSDVQEVWDTLVATFQACLWPEDSAASPAQHAMPAAPTAPPPTIPARDAEPAAADAIDVEARVLDCLTDVIFASAVANEMGTTHRLIAVLDRGCTGAGDPAAPHGGRLAPMCLRKLFVLCSRHDSPSAPTGSPHHAVSSQDKRSSVAVAALPVFLRRCRNVLDAYAQGCTHPISTRGEHACQP